MKLNHIFLNTQHVSYSSNQSQEQIKSLLEGLPEVNENSLSGRMTDDTEFTIYDKMNVIGWSSPNLKRKSAYAYGNFEKVNSGTLINLRIQPNSMLPLFSFVATVGGVVLLLMILSLSQYDIYFLIFAILLLIVGIAYYPISTFLRNRLRKKIENVLDLKRV